MNSCTERNNASHGEGPCEFTQNLDLLREIPLFAGLPLETIKVLAYLCVRERFRPGDMLFNQGEADGNAMYVVSGKGTLLHQNDGGRHEVGPVCPGRFLGGLTLLSDTPRLFSLRADEEMVCLILSREKFGKTQEQFPVVMPRIVEMLVKEINIFEQAVLDKTQALEENHEYFGVSLI